LSRTKRSNAEKAKYFLLCSGFRKLYFAFFAIFLRFLPALPFVNPSSRKLQRPAEPPNRLTVRPVAAGEPLPAGRNGAALAMKLFAAFLKGG
jgi:hypothetical protein